MKAKLIDLEMRIRAESANSCPGSECNKILTGWADELASIIESIQDGSAAGKTLDERMASLEHHNTLIMKSFADVWRRIKATNGRLDDMGKRLQALEHDHTRYLEDIGTHHPYDNPDWGAHPQEEHPYSRTPGGAHTFESGDPGWHPGSYHFGQTAQPEEPCGEFVGGSYLMVDKAGQLTESGNIGRDGKMVATYRREKEQPIITAGPSFSHGYSLPVYNRGQPKEDERPARGGNVNDVRIYSMGKVNGASMPEEQPGISLRQYLSQCRASLAHFASLGVDRDIAEEEIRIATLEAVEKNIEARLADIQSIADGKRPRPYKVSTAEIYGRKWALEELLGKAPDPKEEEQAVTIRSKIAAIQEYAKNANQYLEAEEIKQCSEDEIDTLRWVKGLIEARISELEALKTSPDLPQAEYLRGCCVVEYNNRIDELKRLLGE